MIFGLRNFIWNSRRLAALPSQVRCYSDHAAKPHETAKTTALYDFHVSHKGKMVNFGGYMLPVQYGNDSIIASHLHTRSYGSIFDVSHMLQTYVRGQAAIDCMESLCTADIANAPMGSAVLTCFTNANGGILDDLIVTKVDNELLYVVSNAAMKTQDMSLINEAAEFYRHKGRDVHVEFLPVEEQSLIAVQGPMAVVTLAQLLKSNDAAQQLEGLNFMRSMVADVAGVPKCRITRCGYTGEDGVEISVPSSKAQHIADALLQLKVVPASAKTGTEAYRLKLAGLGARDTLRLEAGLCLYGSDLNANITPVEAGLTWLIAKRRRQTLDFPGAMHIVKQINKAEPLKCRRFGLIMQEAEKNNNVPAARSGVQVLDPANGAVVGAVTSGCPSPTLNLNIAMAYWQSQEQHFKNIPLQLRIRGKLYDAKIAKMPFVPTNYKLQTNKTK